MYTSINRIDTFGYHLNPESHDRFVGIYKLIEKISTDLYNITMMTSGEGLNHSSYAKTIESLNDSYNIVIDEEVSFTVNKEDIIKMFNIFYINMISNKVLSTNMSIFFGNVFNYVKDIDKDSIIEWIDFVRNNHTYLCEQSENNKLNIEVKKIITYIFIKIGVIENYDTVPSSIMKMAIRNVKGKIKSLDTWKNKFISERESVKEFISSIKMIPEYTATIESMEKILSTGELNSINREIIKSILKIIDAIKNNTPFENYKNEDDWKVSKNIYDILTEYFKENNTFITEFEYSIDPDSEESAKIELRTIYKKMYSLIKKTEFSIPLFKIGDRKFNMILDFSGNYLTPVKFEIGNHSVINGTRKHLDLHIANPLNKADIIKLQFNIPDNDFFNYNYTISVEECEVKSRKVDAEIKNKNQIVLTRSKRYFNLLTGKADYISYRAVLKEMEICLDEERYAKNSLSPNQEHYRKFSLKIMPNWEVSDSNTNVSRMFGCIGNSKVPSDIFKAKFYKDGFNLASIHGAIFASIDFGENDNIMKIGKFIHTGNNINHMANPKIEHIQYVSFSEYYKHKMNTDLISGAYFGDYYQTYSDLANLGNKILYFMRSATQYDTQYHADNFAKKCEAWNTLIQSQLIAEIINYRSNGEGFVKNNIIQILKQDFNQVFNNNILDIIKKYPNYKNDDNMLKALKFDKNFLINMLFKLYQKIWNLHKANRCSNKCDHSYDYKWIDCIDVMKRLMQFMSYFGVKNKIEDPNLHKHINEYRDNVVIQYRKNISSFIRDVCYSYNVEHVFCEKLSAESYIGENTDSNRRRSNFAPAELKNDIDIALNWIGVSMSEVDEAYTSKLAPNKTLAARHSDLGWKKIFYFDNETIKEVHADENACDNILFRGLSFKANKVHFKLNRKISLQSYSTKISLISIFWKILVQKFPELETIEQFNEISNECFDFIESEIKDLFDGKIPSEAIYYFDECFITKNEKDAIVNSILTIKGLTVKKRAAK